MLVCLQWTLAVPQDWINLPVAAGAALWRNLPKKPPPTRDTPVNNQPGHIFDLCIQGIHFYGFDHVALEAVTTDHLRVYCWNTDVTSEGPEWAESQPAPYRWGEVWDLHPPRPDPRFPIYVDEPEGAEYIVKAGPKAWGHINGLPHKVNTVQRKKVYVEPAGRLDMERFFPQETSSGLVPLLDWSEWVDPPAELTRHGVWITSEELWRQHFNVRSQRGWREWA